MLYREWNIRPVDEEKAQALAGAVGIGSLLAKILVARGIDTPEAYREMMAEDMLLPDPFLMQDMDKAVQRIHAAVQNEQRIVVFGDYDVDGITATSLLYTYLYAMDAQVFYKLPSRSDDDYGLSPAMVDQMADRGIDLIITVDNGVTAFPAAQRAKERGIGLVVTDHHLPYDTLPEVDALVNPCRRDDESGLSGLSGAGVAFMLLAALEGVPAEEMLQEFGDLAAIGTVADVMKLTGPNRVLVRAGLEALQNSQRPGLAALIEACGWGGREVTVENISYGIAPRLNAAGRMDDATTALCLLLAEDPEEAEELVLGLQEQNTARQKAEQEILALIDSELDANAELGRSRVLVIWGDGWHQGVIGIVASRLVDKYAKPAIVISFDGEDGKGSGRSVAGFSLHGAIASCEDILLRYGGHDLAAGFSLKKENAEEFRKRVNLWAAENAPVITLPALEVDAVVPLSALSVDEVNGLNKLAPCGSGNPSPRLMVQNAAIDGIYPVSEGKHSRLRLRQGGSTLYAAMFGAAPNQLAYRVGDIVDVLVSLSVYEGKQGPQVSARVLELRPAGLGNGHVEQSAWFESFYAGGRINGGQLAALAPSREDTAAVYRLLRDGAHPVNYSDLRPAFARLGEAMSGKALAALAALEELGLIERDEATGCYKVAAVNGKKDLKESSLLQRLGYA